MAVSLSQLDHDYFRICALQSKCENRLKPRNVETNTEWKLLPEMYHKTIKIIFQPKVDVFALRLFYKVPLLVKGICMEKNYNTDTME